MSVLSALLGRRPERRRPDLAAWIGGASPLLVVDGDGSAADLPGATVVRHTLAGGAGLPYHFPDRRRLAAKDGEFRAVVLAGVIGQVIDAGAAFDEVRRVTARGGAVVLVQAVAPEDFEERATWNAIERMCEPRHASAPSARQLAAMVSSSGFSTEREAAWDATLEHAPLTGPAAALLASAAARGARRLVRDGAFVVERRAFLLRKA